MPDHEKERIVREKALAKYREEKMAKHKAANKKAAPNKEGDKGDEGEAKEKYDESKWPPRVAEAYRLLFRSGIAVMPDAARQLALLGLPADMAMRRVITHPRLAVKKRAFTSLMLVQMFVFRTADLIKLLESADMPYVQRAAIESLGMIGTKEAKEALSKMKETLEAGGEKRRQEELAAKDKRPPRPEPGHAGHGHGAGEPDTEDPDPSTAPGGPNPFAPLISFIDKALARERTLGLSSEQLEALDAVQQSSTAAQLKEAIKGIKDLSYEPGLAILLGSPVTSELVKVGAALRLIELARDKPGQVLAYCSPGFPPMLRMAAARFVLERKDPVEVEKLTRIAANDQDPMSAALQELLIKKPVLPSK